MSETRRSKLLAIAREEYRIIQMANKYSKPGVEVLFPDMLDEVRDAILELLKIDNYSGNFEVYKKGEDNRLTAFHFKE